MTPDGSVEKKLSGDQSKCISVPASVVLDKDSNDKRVSAFSYFAVRRGLDDVVEFSVNSIVKWAGRVPNRHRGRINDVFADAIRKLADDEHISVLEDVGNSSYVEAVFNVKQYNRYAVIYVDELKKVFGYNGISKGGSSMSLDVVLLVLSYLRLMIWKSGSDAEAWSGYYNNIADDLGIGEKAVSKSIDILMELDVIYHERLPRKKVNGKWITNYAVFCNMYKRYRNELVADGEDYYMTEIRKKKQQLNVYDKNRKS